MAMLEQDRPNATAIQSRTSSPWELDSRVCIVLRES
jgi:hypothetical protein